jgi:hypothetical protein
MNLVFFLIRNIDMSTAYETELAELRQKLEQAERQLSRGQGEMEAKVRALERLR